MVMKKYIIICIAVIMTALSAKADILIVSDQKMVKNQSTTCVISLKRTNHKTYVSFQMDLTLPEGITINKDECDLGNCIKDENQELTIGKIGDNKYRIISTSFSLIEIYDNPRVGINDDIINLSLKATENTSGGVATLSNIRFAQNLSGSVGRIIMDDVSFNISIENVIEFADATVKSICVNNWDKNGDGELDTGEAASVGNLNNVFKGNTIITSFDELQYFGIYSIQNDSFNGCTGLKSLVLPDHLQNIYHRAFKNCTGLTSLTIPNNVTTIGESSFQGCSSLTSLVLPNNVTTIGRCAFEGCSALTTINIPNSVTEIGTRLFYGCKSLTSVTIPNEVTSISMLAFFGCSSLNSINIPSSVTSIGDGALNCENLISVTVNQSSPISLSYSITAYYSNTILCVPKGSKAAYEEANYWKKYSKILEHSNGIIIGDANGDSNISVTDIALIVNHILSIPNGENFSVTGADANGDGEVTVTDIGVIVDMILGTNNASSRELRVLEPQ